MFRFRTPKFEGALCGSCPGVCCRDVIIPLKSEEYDYLARNGTTLRQAVGSLAEQYANGGDPRTLYVMAGRCGLLNDEGFCSDYENRPEFCREIPEGGDLCREARDRRLGLVMLEYANKASDCLRTDPKVLN